MSIEVYNLYQIDLDTFDNKTIILEKTIIGSFFTTREDTAHKKCSRYIRDMQLPKFYLGGDGEVYPKFEITRSYTK
jgi:hypothetical protein